MQRVASYYFVSMTLRRILALLLLLAAGLAQGESVWGELRDGEVHHESDVAAFAHAATADGEHGHEDARVPEHRHGGDHQHGTHADHCTHQHGVALPADPGFDFWQAVTANVAVEAYLSTDRPSSGFFHPPKA
jgi:ABC-type nickel/cobalt efflux system permease component RcnA